MNGISEDFRYTAYRLGAHFCWWTAFAWTAALTWVRLIGSPLDPPTKFEQVSGLFIILLMGGAIAMGSALARMRLAKTITEVFNVGVKVASSGAKERQEQIIHMLKEELAEQAEQERIDGQ